MNVQAIASEQARENMVDGKLTGLPTMVFEHHAHVYLGGKNVELYHFGRAHTNGDVVAYFPAQRTLAAGDMFTFGDATPELIDYCRRRQRQGMDRRRSTRRCSSISTPSSRATAS